MSGNGEGCRCRPSCPEINKILPARLRLSVLPALRILYSFATSVVHSSGATRGLRFLESYEYTILWQILAALASGKKGPYRHAARGAGGLESGDAGAGWWIALVAGGLPLAGNDRPWRGARQRAAGAEAGGARQAKTLIANRAVRDGESAGWRAGSAEAAPGPDRRSAG